MEDQKIVWEKMSSIYKARGETSTFTCVRGSQEDDDHKKISNWDFQKDGSYEWLAGTILYYAIYMSDIVINLSFLITANK